MGISTLMHGLSTKDPRPSTAAVTSDKLSDEELLRNRYQNGPNIGALFVQEKWIDSSLFKEGEDTGGSELGALKSWGSKPDLKELKAKWEQHWDQFVTDEDLKEMKNRGVTCVRLPIGFWSLGDSKLLKSTDFEEYADVYENSWDYVSKLISRLANQNIGVVLDFHALPGGANGDEHSGTGSGKAELWEHSKFRENAIRAYKVSLSLIRDIPNIVALQLVNEAPYGESKCPGFYLDAASKIREEQPGLPLVISDGWSCDSWVDQIKKWNSKLSDSGSEVGRTDLVIDTHVYRTFSDEDKGKSADEHINNAPNAVQFSDEVDIFVGEWSCCLDEASWSKSSGDRGQLEAEYGKRQLQCYQQLAGNFFWVLKFGQGNGGSWDWRTMSNQGVILPRIEPGKGDLKSELSQALDQHRNYWDNQDGSVDWEHWRFQDGFQKGWADAEQFAQFDGSRPGLIASLKAARQSQHAKEKGHSDKLWVFGQAYIQGIRARVNA